MICMKVYFDFVLRKKFQFFYFFLKHPPCTPLIFFNNRIQLIKIYSYPKFGSLRFLDLGENSGKPTLAPPKVTFQAKNM